MAAAREAGAAGGFRRGLAAEPDRPVVEVPTRITVKETDINKFAYSFGYGTEEQLSGEAQWRHLNLFGGGRAGTIRGRWSSIDRGGEAAFRQPYLFTSKLSLQVSAYVWEWDEPVYSVLSRGGRNMPSRGNHVKVKGVVRDVAVFGGVPLGLHLEERDLDIKRN